MRFDFESWELEDEPMFSGKWEDVVKKLPAILGGTGFLGTINLVTVPPAGVMSQSRPIPIIYCPEYKTMAVAWNTRRVVPICIRVGYRYEDYVSNGMYVPFLWHEVGHIVHGDGETYKPKHRNFNMEVSADDYSAEHVGRDVMAQSLDKLAEWQKDQTPDNMSYLELRVRAAILGSEDAKSYLKANGVSKRRFLEMVKENNSRIVI